MRSTALPAIPPAEPKLRALPPPLKRRRPSAIPWVLLILVAGGAAVAVSYLWKHLENARGALGSKTDALSAAERRVSVAELRVKDAEGALDRERKSQADELDKLNQKLVAVQSKAKVADEMAEKLKASVASSDGELEQDGDKLTLRLVDKLLFRSGEADLTPGGVKVLERVGKVLQEYDDKQIWVQGHTDDRKIMTNEFPSNWELSTARALTVVHYLEDQSKVDPSRLAAVGFGQYRPVSRSKRAKNRRIEIVLFPQKVKMLHD
jgi:chemotaxis protein MotB